MFLFSEGPKSLPGKTFFLSRMKIFFFPTRLQNVSLRKINFFPVLRLLFKTHYVRIC